MEKYRPSLLIDSQESHFLASLTVGLGPIPNVESNGALCENKLLHLPVEFYPPSMVSELTPFIDKIQGKVVLVLIKYCQDYHKCLI